MEIWVRDLGGLAPTSLFRCSCHGRRRCDYHRADWPLILRVVIEEFRAECGDGPAEWRTATEILVPRIEGRLRGRRRTLERAFAVSLFTDPMLASSDQWTNGQHRCQAAMDAGCLQMLFCG